MAVSDRLPFPTLGTCRFMDVIATPSGSDPVLYRKGSQLYLANASLEQVAYIRKTGAYTLLVSDHRVVGADTTAAAFTLTLPASPTDGMSWLVFDAAAAGSWHTNNLTLSGNGKSIVIAGAAAAATVAFASRSGAFRVYYHATSDRWHVVEQSASGAAPGAHASTHLAGGSDPLLAAPGAIGGTTPAAGTFTALTVNTSLALAAGADVSAAAGASDIDWSLSTGFFKFPTGHIDWTGAAGKQVTLTQGVATSGSPYAVKVVGGAHTTLAASTEANDVYFDLSRTVQFATGALTTQRAFLIDAPTYAAVAASTITNAATLAIADAPQAGTNATITNPYAFWVQAGMARFDGPVNFGRGTVSQATNINTGVTLNAASGVITTQAAATAAGAIEAGFTLTNSCIVAGSVVTLQIVAYSGTWFTNGVPYLVCEAPGAGSVVIKVANIHGANALNGTMEIHFIVA